MGHLSGYQGNPLPYRNESPWHPPHELRQSAQKKSWTKLIGDLRAQARNAYYRELCLAKRILYVHTYVLARAWFTA